MKGLIPPEHSVATLVYRTEWNSRVFSRNQLAVNRSPSASTQQIYNNDKINQITKTSGCTCTCIYVHVANSSRKLLHCKSTKHVHVHCT